MEGRTEEETAASYQTHNYTIMRLGDLCFNTVLKLLADQNRSIETLASALLPFFDDRLVFSSICPHGKRPIMRIKVADAHSIL